MTFLTEQDFEPVLIDDDKYGGHQVQWEVLQMLEMHTMKHNQMESFVQNVELVYLPLQILSWMWNNTRISKKYFLILILCFNPHFVQNFALGLSAELQEEHPFPLYFGVHFVSVALMQDQVTSKFLHHQKLFLLKQFLEDLHQQDYLQFSGSWWHFAWHSACHHSRLSHTRHQTQEIV